MLVIMMMPKTMMANCNEEVKHRPPTKKAPNDCNKPPDGDILMLIETDIPGASLNGKSPNQLTVEQLKRWLICCGAPVSGKKSDLIERSVANNKCFFLDQCLDCTYATSGQFFRKYTPGKNIA